MSNSASENEKSRHKPDRLQNPYYRSLARKMITLVLVVSLTPMLLVSGVILYEFQKSHKEKVYAHLGELVEKHRQNIETFLNEKLNDVRFLGKSLFDDQINDITALQNRLEAFQQVFSPAFVDLGVVDAQGIQIAYVGPFKLDKAQYSDADWFKKASNSDYFISDVFLGLRGLPHFIIAVRENWAGNPTIIRATIDFVAFNNLVERIRIGATGFAFILNRNGELQTQTTPENLPQKGPYRDFLGIRQEEGTIVHIGRKNRRVRPEEHLCRGFFEKRRLAARLPATGLRRLLGPATHAKHCLCHHHDRGHRHRHHGAVAVPAHDQPDGPGRP